VHTEVVAHVEVLEGTEVVHSEGAAAVEVDDSEVEIEQKVVSSMGPDRA